MQRGFTLTEIIIVIGIIALFSAVGLLGLRSMLYSVALKAASTETYSALTSARAHTMASENNTMYGVHVSSTSVTYFEGPTYINGAASNRVYIFERGVTATGTLVTNNNSIIFKRLSGQTNVQGTIYLRDAEQTATNTILIESSGLIEFQ